MALSGNIGFSSPNLGPVDDDAPEELLLSGEALAKLKDEAKSLPSIQLTPRQICDVEMLLNGGFSPLKGFLLEEEYNTVVKDMRLLDGRLWSMPITLDLFEKDAKAYKLGDRVVLRDEFGNPLAVMTIQSIWKPNKAFEAENVFGSPDDVCHPSIDYLFNEAGDV